MKHQTLQMIRSLALSAAILLPAAAADTDSARSAINDGLQSTNPVTRKQAVESMALVAGDPQTQARLERMMLGDKDVNVRVAAISTIMIAPTGTTADALKKALGDPAPEVSFAAAKALFTLNDPAGKEALLGVLSGDKKSSSGIMTERKREAARMMHDPKKLTVFAATRSTWLIPVPGVGFGVNAVADTFTNSRGSGRAATAMLLATEEDDPEVGSALRTALTDKDASVRSAAIQAIALRNDSSAKADVAPLMEDKSQAVRLWAAAAYLRLDGIESSRTKDVASAGGMQTAESFE